MIIIYCDGACSFNHRSNNNKGGWGAVIDIEGEIAKIKGGERNTTNQRMEITACIKALEYIKNTRAEIAVFSDSAYLVNCIHDQWYERWQRNGWKNVKNQVVENRDLWEKLLTLLANNKVTFHKVTGHAGNKLNEMADEQAKQAIKEIK